MVGRDTELRRLARLLDVGQPQVAMVAGEPGIGKTRLIRELAAITPPGTRVLIGQADPGTLSRPFELLLDAIDQAADPIDPTLLAAVTDTGRAMVDRLRAGIDLVRTLVSSGPSMIVFEDLHWADSESAALFERIADLPAPARLLIGTYRPDEVTRRHPIADLLTRLDRRHAVNHLRLARFTLTDTSAFLAAVSGRPAPYRAAVTLHHRTGGSPFFLEELLRAANNRDMEQLCEQPLPWSLAEALRRQLDEIDPERQRVVEAAAVLGRKIPFDLLAAVTRTPEDVLIATLRDLVRRGLMVELGEDEFSFRHALTREALVDHLLGRERRRLHELALETLLATGSNDWALVAHHARGAGRYDDVIPAARQGAASYLAIGSPYQALQLAEDGLAEAPNDVDLLSCAAQAAWLIGLLDDANRHARRWLAATTTPQDHAAALRLLIRVAWESSRFDDMTALTDELESVIAVLPRSPDLARAMATAAQSYMLRELPDAAVAWVDRTIALTDEFDLPQVRVAAEVEKGSSLTLTAETAQEGGQLLLKAAAEAEKIGEWLLAARAINNLIETDLVFSPDELACLIERMRADAERAGFDSLAVTAYHNAQARLAIQKGNLAAAIGAVEEGRRRDQGLLRTTHGVDHHSALLAGLTLEADEVDRAAAIVAGITSARERLTYVIPGLEFHVACRLGDTERAEAALDDIFGVIAESGPPAGDYTHDLVSAALFAGLDLTRIRELAGLMRRLPVEAWGWLVDGQLAEVAGEPLVALTAYLRAAAEPPLPPAPKGTAETGAARCLLALGRPDEARAHAQRAAELLRRWAGWRVAQLESVNARLGIPQEAVGTTVRLTPREREVALLLASGLTNAELARRLYISPRTAAVHVSSILAKLGLSSRTQVAAYLRDFRS